MTDTMPVLRPQDLTAWGSSACFGGVKNGLSHSRKTALGGPMTTLDHGTYFTSLPREYYVSPEHFATELEEVWARQWVYVGHISQIPKRGDYFTFELANE